MLLFLFGLYCRLVPAAGTMTRAKVQGWLHMRSAILFSAGVALKLLKGKSFIAAPIVGSFIMVAAMALFALIVFPAGVAIVISKGESLVAIPVIGALVVLIAVALFAVVVFRTSGA